jgi:hypothetical protein
MQALAALYTLMVAECDNPEYATVGALNDTFVRARDDMLKGPGGVAKLPAVRKRCGAEVAAVFGTDAGAALTDPVRTKAKAVYAALARAVLAAVPS